MDEQALYLFTICSFAGITLTRFNGYDLRSTDDTLTVAELVEAELAEAEPVEAAEVIRGTPREPAPDPDPGR